MSLKPRILYVDDDVLNCEFMKFWLGEESGFDVTTVIDGRTAFPLIESEFFDLYLLDYCLPDTTAVQLCHKIRSINPSVPIMVYSALDREIDRRNALEAGADRYLLKPDQLFLVKPEMEKLLGISAAANEKQVALINRDRTQKISISHKKRKPAGIV